jgi:hypothetical protein
MNDDVPWQFQMRDLWSMSVDEQSSVDKERREIAIRKFLMRAYQVRAW